MPQMTEMAASLSPGVSILRRLSKTSKWVIQGPFKWWLPLCLDSESMRFSTLRAESLILWVLWSLQDKTHCFSSNCLSFKYTNLIDGAITWSSVFKYKSMFLKSCYNWKAYKVNYYKWKVFEWMRSICYIKRLEGILSLFWEYPGGPMVKMLSFHC